ncbi:MAG TPA: CPBP family intramembrane glutamic endopeptidase, partial [Gemmatimonadaceae bacterium]|nr:CPBP family intramembrane glutamic endopeptidase [Gemmatimonadaceae bacterium]
SGWEFVGLHRAASEPRLLGAGLLYGLLPIAIPSLFLLMTGDLKAVGSMPGSSGAAAGISFANLLPGAFYEELLLRGYLFAVLRDAIGWRWTLISTSVTFGLLHMWNPGADAQSIAIVMLAGFFLGSVFLATQSLYAATVAHFIWNWFLAAGLHTPVSGIKVSSPDYRVVDAGPDWLTGGAWGPEGGFAAAVGVFAVMIYLYARRLRRMES